MSTNYKTALYLGKVRQYLGLHQISESTSREFLYTNVKLGYNLLWYNLLGFIRTENEAEQIFCCGGLHKYAAVSTVTIDIFIGHAAYLAYW